MSTSLYPDFRGYFAGHVYRIYCSVDNKSYVGSSFSVKRRKSVHFSMLRRGIHHCIHLQRAWDKYGAQSFEFEILEEVMVTSDSDLREIENKYFSLFSLYNTCPVAGSPLGVVHTEETRRKVSNAGRGRKLTDNHKALIGIASASRKHSSASRAKMSEVAKNRGMAVLRAGWEKNRDRIRELTREQNRNRPPASEETRIKTAISGHGHPEGFLFVSTKTGERVRVWNMAAFARERGLNKDGLSAVVTGRQVKHYEWKLAKDDEKENAT